MSNGECMSVHEDRKSNGYNLAEDREEEVTHVKTQLAPR